MLEAIEIVKEMGYELPAEKINDLDPGGERTIAKYVKENMAMILCLSLIGPSQRDRSITCASQKTPP